MILDKFTPMTKIEIWEPRYHDRMVLLHVDKVRKAQPHIKVVFTKTKSDTFAGDWYISKKAAMKFKKDWNGSAYCYAIPFDKLEVLEINERPQIALW